MGISSSLDIFQQRMCDLMKNLAYLLVYLDDVLELTKCNLNYLVNNNLVLGIFKTLGQRLNVA